MIEIKNIHLQRGHKVLLNNANATIMPKQRVGLIGKNGTGKSSLLALIKGDIHADSGDVVLPPHWQIASVSQETPALSISALDYVLQGDATRQALYAQLSQAENENHGIKMAELHTKLEEIDAYSAPARAAKLLHGLGFAQHEHQQPVHTFSGGWRMRLNLAQALMCRADVLLLDEPTNHLDLETVLWLENHLMNMPCTQIIISHDRDFLNATTTHTLELAQQKLNAYGGNYDFYQTERAQRLAKQHNAYVKQQAQIQHLQSFINRFKAKATKATQAQSRMKALAKLEKIAPAHLDTEFSFEFYPPQHLPNPLLKLENVDLGYDHHTVLHKINLSLENGARYGLLGTNGSGKSTLIKALAGLLTPQQGNVVRAEKLNIGYFAQHQLDILNPHQNPIWHIQTLSPEVKEQEIRNFLGQFHFAGEMATQSIAPFSGGEKARLALAMLIWQKPNLLLLDEPTNHLDLDMRHALTVALQSFQGALILVSHDRNLIETTTDQFLLIHHHTLQNFDGDLNDYRQWRLNQENAFSAPVESSSKKRQEIKRQEAQQRQEKSRLSKPIVQKLAKIEQELEKWQLLKQKSEAFLAEEQSYLPENKTLLQESLNQSHEAAQKLAALEEAWLDYQEQLEEIQR